MKSSLRCLRNIREHVVETRNGRGEVVDKVKVKDDEMFRAFYTHVVRSKEHALGAIRLVESGGIFLLVYCDSLQCWILEPDEFVASAFRPGRFELEKGFG